MWQSLYARRFFQASLAAVASYAVATSANAFDFIYDLPSTEPVADPAMMSSTVDPVPTTTDTETPPTTEGETPAPPLDPEDPVLPPTDPPSQHAPEPGTLLLGVIGTAAAGWYARRRPVA